MIFKQLTNKYNIMKASTKKTQLKYSYSKVIQQNYGYGQGWEDVSEYTCNSQGKTSEMSGKFKELKYSGKKRELTLLEHDLAEYKYKCQYPTRVIFRRTLITNNQNI